MDSEIFPSLPTGGCLCTITERSLRTTIRCTPVWGPAPVRYRVSGPPEGWPIVNETVVGFPAAAIFVGSKPTRRKVLAGAIVICGGELEDDDEQPTRARTNRASGARRMLRGLSGRGSSRAAGRSPRPPA